MMLKEYTDAFGVSGCEKEIREIIKSKVQELGETRVDKLGNLIVHKKGNGKRVMLAAHMDEVGFIVTKIKDDGRIIFRPVGGIDPRILISKRVVFGRTKTVGVIGSKPIHLQSPSERNSPVDIKELFIDIGATSKDEVQKYVKPGDYATFESQYVDMGKYIKAKALDDRVGCAVVTEMLKDDFNLDIYGTFTVQEEVGLRGAGVAAFAIEPEIALIFEGTTCADIAKDEKDYVTTPGEGPAISLMDRTSSANGKLLKRIVEIAEKNNIPYQYRRGKFGGNDAGRIHRTKEGCLTATISVPTRYIHSPISMINKEDYENTINLVKLVLRSLEEEDL
ncbi:M42 family metallopeptidase [Fonticella tunisiensis]|uniref:Endoglucanase n=1 Tax=Fonticella tunisiensis TaxID=1096341 RepID=A0A4R7KQS2_9CLOT|nr:M42 family metallopeptidase [Fonticella tunisiensis]TDT60933.1 endoglucanase [Fonticella tunisiensis]